MSDVVEQAKAALEGVSDGPWDYEHAFGASFVCAGDRHRTTAQAWILRADTESGKRQDKVDARFVAQARTLVPELVAEVERLRAEFDQAVADWGENDEQMLAENARLAAEVEELSPLPRGVEEYLRLVEADDPVEAFDMFVKQWVAPKWHGHLLDSDDNDGEAVRRIIRRYTR